MATPSKDHILREIKRLAAENGGVPVGGERFEALTGITQAKWRGRYWARWGDAVREAGYEPGKWQSQVHEDDELLRFLALETRDLGHFPTIAELRMRRQIHPEIPSDKVFGNRFGNKAAVVRRVVEYADAHPDLADVAEMCAPLVDQTPAKAKVAPADSVVTGVVYLIRMGEYHKIGKSNDPGRRSYELGCDFRRSTTLSTSSRQTTRAESRRTGIGGSPRSAPTASGSGSRQATSPRSSAAPTCSYSFSGLQAQE